MKYFAKVVSNFKVAFGGKVAFLALRKSMVSKFSQETDVRDTIFKYLRAIKGIEVIVILTEHGKNKTKINLRSQGKFDVARLALHFGGGGHKKASGCMISGSIKQAQEKVALQIKKEMTQGT